MMKACRHSALGAKRRVSNFVRTLGSLEGCLDEVRHVRVALAECSGNDLSLVRAVPRRLTHETRRWRGT